MKIILFLFATCFAFHANSQKVEYVCQPCGSECDLTTHAGPGVCPVCNMPLVDKATLRFTNLAPREFCARISANPQAIILDVRSPEEFAGTSKQTKSFGHFRNAININVKDLERRLGELTKYKDQEILVYCSHSRRSPSASYLLGIKGFSNVKNMTGGVSTINQLAQEECFGENYVVHAN